MGSRSLQRFVQEVDGESRLRVEHDFGGGFVRLQTSEAERRQAAQDIRCSEDIVIELLRNARDAHAAHIFIATGVSAGKRTICVIDDGDGIPPAMHEHVFEPRVTSKLDTSHRDNWGLHGRGMALYSIAENAESACVVASGEGLGCAMRVVSDTRSLPEKSDQSSFPQFVMGEDGTVNVRGPRNIARTACEFAIAERGTCSVYLGSAAEVVATAFELGKPTLSEADRVFGKNLSSVPLVNRIAASRDPAELAELASTIGLEVSERTARRIMDGAGDGLVPLIDLVAITREPTGEKRAVARKRTDGMRLRISDEDRAEFARALGDAFASLADRYYLRADVQPTVTVAHGKLNVSFPLVEED